MYLSKKINEITEPQLKHLIAEIVKQTAKDFAQNLDKSELEHICKRTFETITKFWKFETWSTVKNTFENGVRGVYGENYKFNAISVLSWLNKQKSQIRAQKQSEFDAAPNFNKQVNQFFDTSLYAKCVRYRIFFCSEIEHQEMCLHEFVKKVESGEIVLPDPELNANKKRSIFKA
jgi:phage-related protein